MKNVNLVRNNDDNKLLQINDENYDQDNLSLDSNCMV